MRIFLLLLLLFSAMALARIGEGTTSDKRRLVLTNEPPDRRLAREKVRAR
jgi:hypothetical protein